jgi:hypothetical protein
MNPQPLIAARGPGLKAFAIGAVLSVLAGLAGIATVREWRTAAPTPVSAFQDAPRKAFSAEEERFAQALFAVHEQVKNGAVNMMFAGIAFKTNSLDRQAFKARVAPLVATFAGAQAQFEKIAVPESMQAIRKDYAEALRLYRVAVDEIQKTAADGKEDHLLVSHELSQRAAGILLDVGEKVWPGEYKPN